MILLIEYYTNGRGGGVHTLERFHGLLLEISLSVCAAGRRMQ